MRDAERSFVERWSRILAAEGLPPVAGRLWAWLLVCEPREQSVDDIAEAIGASRGAISGAVRWLEPSGLRVLSDREARGAQPWVPPQPRPRDARTAAPREAPPPSTQALEQPGELSTSATARSNGPAP